ncbi:unnamed protein product [Musa acuminata subsp. malaccensis]|uniref:(wild Malaysian banana) hypothetical protein n=1 Tax=Musa acuminata subsp. malaccensis TaxID=214687 RepID=A0A804ITS7_MUSAM|nr:unnamed protein product [Musa acuminata subsp. malaccensis]
MLLKILLSLMTPCNLNRGSLGLWWGADSLGKLPPPRDALKASVQTMVFLHMPFNSGHGRRLFPLPVPL